jgi:Ni/Co efflux regulator RcnB
VNNPVHATRKVIFTLALGASLLAAAPLVTAPAAAKHGRHREDRRHREVVVADNCYRPVVVAQRPVRVIRAPRRVVVADFASASCRAPYAGARWVQVDGRRYYYNASFGFYVGGVALDFQLTNRPPHGWVYYDPVCSDEFRTLDAYQMHLHRHDHSGALAMVRVSGSD